MALKKDDSPYERIRFLNAEVDNISMQELVENFKEGMLLTLHVDMLMKLQKDRDFYNILPEFDVITCDSQIMVFASKFLGHPPKGRNVRTYSNLFRCFTKNFS